MVDDFEPFRRLVESLLHQRPEFEVVCEVSDGLEAVQKAQELQPDILVLDISLPSLNGIDAARQISGCAPRTKILVLSENRSAAVVREALRTGAGAYVLKSDAGTDLLRALEAVLKGERFVSARVNGFESHE